MKIINSGIYPTMITPYKNGEIDYENVKKLSNWYIDRGCHGIFAVCQSSEMAFLSLDERIRLAKEVVNTVNGRISVVASGHVSDGLDAQAEEINAISETGIDAFVFVSNRLDLHNEGDKVWISNAEKLLSKIDSSITLGIYECPMPYKRLLSTEILNWCKTTKRFAFIKDTCCSPDMIKERAEILHGSGIKLFNANAQTLLHSLNTGYDGYAGIMANFHPELLVKLYELSKADKEKANDLSNMLSMAAFTENPAYPCTAKYYLGFEGIDMDIFSRSCDEKRLNDYQKFVMKQLFDLNEKTRSEVL